MVRWALLGTIVIVLVVLVDVSRHGGGNPVSLVQPGRDGPSAQVFAEDFPRLELPDGLGLDGQMYYAVARDPRHLDVVAGQLDRPRYRLQRPLLSWAGALLHPGGGGVGLVDALFLVGILGVVVGAVATGAVSRHLGGPAWCGAVFAVLPGTYWSLRSTVSDALAVGLALAAIAASQRRRRPLAIVAAAAAVLAKEPVLLLFAGWFAHRRDRDSFTLCAAAGATAAAWMGWLRLQLPPDPSSTDDLTLPLRGLYLAWRDIWSTGEELVGMACMVGALVLAAVALYKRGVSHPLGWMIAIQLAFLLCLGPNPTGVNFGATRMTLPVMVLAVVALATPDGSGLATPHAAGPARVSEPAGARGAGP